MFLFLDGFPYIIKIGNSKFHVIGVVPPACRIGQESWNRSITKIYLALYQLSSIQSFYISVNRLPGYTVKYLFVEGDDCFNIIILDGSPELVHCFWLYLFREILFPKYPLYILGVIGGKGVITIKDKVKGSFMFCAEESVCTLIWAFRYIWD